MGKDKKVKHEHEWLIMFDEHGFNEVYIYAECECGKKLIPKEIEEILNKFYKG